MARYAISDIHGCSRTFKTLVLEQLQLKKTDELYLLGDYVNKGPDSKGVLDFIIHLQKQHCQVYCLRGNHDQMLLKAASKGESALNLSEQEKAMVLHNFGMRDFKKLPPTYASFIDALPFYFDLPDYFLVHAGFDFHQDDLFRDKEAMLNIRHYEVDWERLHNKRLLHGHTPTALHAIKKSVAHQDARINLDAGCVYYKNATYGNLVALDLDTNLLNIQCNLDRPYPVRRKS
ncbi:metallophosphoesterase family protein [Pontibacter ramchanderi]|uniref:Serine/threonine protein phosphatase 1 n=1 Tax=Pontibacter ramchanderi TaxID=1179743 RepID=A0A2N3UD50_9BACT|nr:metallophosphoesterase family protein [Pontibacter ramchanderi]PKV67265.1 serine/threonine protein phosphatase 1 [Pontibacter ramchanderi]